MQADDGEHGMTWEELLALPPAVDLELANRALGLGRSKGYDLARRGRYPCPTWRAGPAHRVSTADLWRLLGIDPAQALGNRAA
ncbi:hypothetical protein GT354_08830 [Streptomyces sp. SID3343]|nr:hypothetical protein [Streptomyces sp. SID3343]